MTKKERLPGRRASVSIRSFMSAGAKGMVPASVSLSESFSEKFTDAAPQASSCKDAAVLTKSSFAFIHNLMKKGRNTVMLPAFFSGLQQCGVVPFLVSFNKKKAVNK